MQNNDFNLDLVSTSKEKKQGASPRITSISLCTAGCITGRIMGCHKTPTVSCNCH
ncbi:MULTISPECIES: gallidermin/nisin family lantibiotic [Streptococcus]|uniref:Lantibiotic n=1 Tax=Streptococcus suis TaxID=1307 RepID=A0AB37G933_STRSU|nr:MULTISPECIES: gallidermin/nisin family lantibiotic [Streptococcus]MBM7138019.1 gallidermin/nisin family lantibiotic [Streptococcus suis]MBM7284627.1 gallidermin/nisin family lantibiotic [Streptococcus suis]MBY4600801.1 gallidermin/nisin family lantibiotic [Streptococcus suis]MCK3935026.1 gallidermin/nisin family lantibiotic [Streptococcus suis]MCO8237828.1 gallidermin/nisin family lantibiotic [Streptococcus suis]